MRAEMRLAVYALILVLCELCGKLVKSDSSPARLETLVAADGSVAGRSVRHLQGCPG